MERRRADLAASYQAAVVGQLTAKLERALRQGEWRAVALGGGVAANSLLRERAAAICERLGLRLKLVPGELCTDNAAMIASAARFLEPAPYPEYLELGCRGVSDGDALHAARTATSATRPGRRSWLCARSSAPFELRRSTSTPTTRSTPATWSGSRWSRSTARWSPS